MQRNVITQIIHFFVHLPSLPYHLTISPLAAPLDETDVLPPQVLDETDERVGVQRFMAHVPDIPSQADVVAALVERKKELVAGFLGDEG